MTENHGVPGSNPGPATLEIPAKRGKTTSFGGVSGTLSQWHVNSRIEKWSLLGRLLRSLACLLCGADVDSEGHPVIGVTWTDETRVA
jgi:hypothetical protein